MVDNNSQPHLLTFMRFAAVRHVCQQNTAILRSHLPILAVVSDAIKSQNDAHLVDDMFYAGRPSAAPRERSP